MCCHDKIQIYNHLSLLFSDSNLNHSTTRKETNMANTITTQELEILSNKAISAKSTAYCPYSKFRVGASLLTHSGEYITGANVENVSFPVGTCAERVAFGTAVVNGHKEFKAVAVASDITPGASPCGMCRQFMREFLTPSVPIYMYDGQGGHIVKTMGELLPNSFGPDDLR
ncbi:cytidine deaminase [Aspergillus chevalieri]|uniref:Cytidine deaminase n=1 Tax=Aspergillus chevalieri TaxID=182096 RepID=A0A7R7ZRY5_ASPCH|nr:uncharacterized protein ACHE_80213A [Aspergillus chevalieri]BCR92313.1 hypothetical protein ACHE_80213A [Aspergillus chevalieri]